MIDGLLELGGGGGKCGGENREEGESGGDGNVADAQLVEGDVDVFYGGEDGVGEVGAGGEYVGPDGDGGNTGTGVEGDDMGVEPGGGVGAVGSEGGDVGVGDGEEEGDGGVGEGPDEGRVRVQEADGGDVEAL